MLIIKRMLSPVGLDVSIVIIVKVIVLGVNGLLDFMAVFKLPAGWSVCP